MSKTNKKPVDETRAIMKKAIDDKQKMIRKTDLFNRMKNAITEAIASAAADGKDFIIIPDVKVPGELGMPEKLIGMIVSECDYPATVIDTIVDDFEDQGYLVKTLFGCPVIIAWTEENKK